MVQAIVEAKAIVKLHIRQSLGRESALTMAAEHAEAAMRHVVGLMETDDAPFHVRLKAAEIILDRALGKPKQEIKQEVSMNVTHVHLEAVRSLNAMVIEHVDEVEEPTEEDKPRDVEEDKSKGFDDQMAPQMAPQLEKGE